MKVDFYSKDNKLLKENVPAEFVIIKSDSGVPIALARQITPMQFLVHHAGEPNFEQVLVNLGIPFNITIIRHSAPSNQEGKSPYLLQEERKLFVPE